MSYSLIIIKELKLIQGMKVKFFGARLQQNCTYLKSIILLKGQYHIYCYTTVPLLKFDWPSGSLRMVICSITALGCFSICIAQFICAHAIPEHSMWTVLIAFYQLLVCCIRAISQSQLCLISYVIFCGTGCSPADIHHTPAHVILLT